MQIYDNNLHRKFGLGASQGASLDKTGEGSQGKSQNVAASPDSVMLSDLTTLLAGAAGQYEASRGELVGRVAAEYRSGNYLVSNSALADTLLERAFDGW
jgi:anti-sigma28 factor (negative regulator of flagellin synthesis)